ncbi:hypothetical protein O9993_12260 [Vibrio lentus]|nr:hypothetical protein [Vibrio lentus]
MHATQLNEFGAIEQVFRYHHSAAYGDLKLWTPVRDVDLPTPLPRRQVGQIVEGAYADLLSSMVTHSKVCGV